MRGFIFLILAFGGATGAGAYGGPDQLNLQAYTSTCGRFVMHVAPHHRYGETSGNHKMTRDGALVWSNSLPFTLREVAIASNGVAAGYALLSPETPALRRNHPGQFVVALLSPDGTVMAKHVSPRVESRFLHFGPDPHVRGVFLQEDLERFVVRIADPDVNRRIESWRIFSLLDGRELQPVEPVRAMDGFDPTSRMELSVWDARSLPGSGLALIHWRRMEPTRHPPRIGAVFTLADAGFQPVWKLEMPDDYMGPIDEEAHDKLLDELRERGAILGTQPGGQFEIRSYRNERRIAFLASRGADGTWHVTESGRMPHKFGPVAAAVTTAPPASVVWKEKEIVRLMSGAPAPSSRPAGFSSFAFDGSNRFCAVGGDGNLVLLSHDGKALGQVALPNTTGRSAKVAGPAWVGGQQFVVAVSTQGVGAVAEFYLADMGRLTLSRIRPDPPDCPPVDAIAGFPPGKFVALTSRHQRHTITEGLFCFDTAGRQIWRKEQAGTRGDPDELLSPEDICRTDDGKLAVLDNIRHTIQLFDETGGYVRTLKLDEAWGREANYPVKICADGGGFIVWDFHAPVPMVRTGADGRIRSQGRPLFVEGQPADIGGGFAVSGDGELWGCDGRLLVRISPGWSVDRVVGGQMPEAGVLADPGEVSVGADGRIFIADSKTCAVHVFDSAGRKLALCAPRPRELNELSRVEEVTSDPSGGIHVRLWDSKSRLHFDATGAHMKWSGPESDANWRFQTGAPRLWVASFNDVRLFDTKTGRELATIKQTKDGNWLEGITDSAMAPDGSLVVMMGGEERPETFTFLSPTGETLRTVTPSVPVGNAAYNLAFDGRHVFAADDETVSAYATSGTFLARARLLDAPLHGPFVAADGIELWFIDAGGLALRKYSVSDLVR